MFRALADLKADFYLKGPERRNIIQHIKHLIRTSDYTPEIQALKKKLALVQKIMEEYSL